MTNNAIVKLTLFSLLTICLFTLSVSAQNYKSEKVKSVKTIRGKFIKFVVGDFVHPEIKTSDGKIRGFFLESSELQYFLLENRGKTMIFTYEVIETFIMGNDKRTLIERIKSARIGNLTFEKWWKNLNKKYPEDEIRKKYDPLVEKYSEY